MFSSPFVSEAVYHTGSSVSAGCRCRVYPGDRRSETPGPKEDEGYGVNSVRHHFSGERPRKTGTKISRTGCFPMAPGFSQTSLAHTDHSPLNHPGPEVPTQEESRGPHSFSRE